MKSENLFQVEASRLESQMLLRRRKARWGAHKTSASVFTIRNSIRPDALASLRVNGEVQGKAQFHEWKQKRREIGSAYGGWRLNEARR